MPPETDSKLVRLPFVLIAAAFWLTTSVAHAFPARFAVAPDNDLSLLTSTLKSAQRKLLINIYQFDYDPIVSAVIERIRAGVTVQMLIEGQPVGGISDDGKSAILRVRDAMATSRNRQNRLFVMTSVGSEQVRRYRYNHGKYVLIDDARALVASENFSSNGHPASGAYGNRGWETVLEDPQTVKELAVFFAQDTDVSYGDVFRMGAHDAVPLPAKPGTGDDGDDDERKDAPTSHVVTAAATAPIRAVPTLPLGSGQVRDAKVIASPDSLPGLLSFLRAARDTLAVQQMSYPSAWKDAETKEKALSPLVMSLVEAARRGVNVRVLLNDDHAFGGSPNGKMGPNELTARMLAADAACEDLPLEARIIDVKAVGITYIHNKGYLADGHKVLISSINGTQNSVMNNREIAVQLDSADAYRYFENAFFFDWSRSGKLSKKKIPADQAPPSFSPGQGCLERTRSVARVMFPGSQSVAFQGLF